MYDRLESVNLPTYLSPAECTHVASGEEVACFQDSLCLLAGTDSLIFGRVPW